MDYFQKSGLFGLLIVIVFLLLFVPGIVVMAIVRSRLAAVIFMFLALLPLLIGILGTFLGNQNVDRLLEAYGPSMSLDEPEHPQSVVAAGRREAMIPTQLGAGATGLLLAVAGGGLAVARKKP